MPRSDASSCFGPSLNSARRALASFACGVLVLQAGCAGVRRAAVPMPRVRDAATLRAEAQARPVDPEPLYQLALLHYGLGEMEPALGALRSAVGRSPEHAPSLALLAKLLHDCGKSAEGVRWFASHGLETLPDPVRLNVALLYADVGNTRQARRLLQGLVEGPYADAAGANLAYLDLLDEVDSAALARLEAEAKRLPDSAEVQNNLALARLRAGDVEGGARLLRELAAKQPDFAPAQLNLALVLRHYFFDEDGAERAQAHFDALGAPSLSGPALDGLLGGGTEDASPGPPATSEGGR